MIPKSVKKQWANDELDVDLEKEWVKHLTDYKFLWPRDVGFQWRKSVDNPNEYVREIDKRRTSRNVYAQVYSDPMQQDDIYNTAFVDIDVDMEIPETLDDELKETKFDQRIEKAWTNMRKFVRYMEDEYGEQPRVYFSGGRGFAIYADFEPTRTEYGAVVATIQDALDESGVDPEVVDGKVTKDSNRVSRVPYTLNWNTADRNLGPMLCLPIDPDWPFETFLQEIKTVTLQKEVEVTPSTALADEIERRFEEDEYSLVDRGNKDIDVEFGQDPERALERVKKVMMAANHNMSDGRHRTMHFVLVPSLIEAGYGREDIHNMCEKFVNRTGRSYRGTQYEKYVENSIDQNLEGPDGADHPWKPHSLDKFIMENPDLLDHFELDPRDI